jgi:hypothetical protein
LHHYCSPDAFHKIILQGRVRLTLLTLSNDALEGRYIGELAGQFAEEDHAKPALVEQVRELCSKVAALGFCMSANGDLLSQWRGYASDGAGYAIGFDQDQLTKEADEPNVEHPVSLVQILYNSTEQRDQLFPKLDALHEAIRTERNLPYNALSILFNNNATPPPELKQAQLSTAESFQASVAE